MARKAYFAIDQTADGGSAKYRVWRRCGDEGLAEMVGEFATLDEAKAAFPVRWRDGLHLIRAWGWGPVPRPAGIRQVGRRVGRSRTRDPLPGPQTDGRDETPVANL